MPSPGDLVKRVAFHTVADPEQWTVSNEPACLVVTEKNWSTYYSSPPGSSDFANYIYLVASLGLKPNPGYTVRVLRVERLKDSVTIIVELKEPDPRKAYPQILVRPVAVAKVAKADLEPRGTLDFAFIDQKGRQLFRQETEI